MVLSSCNGVSRGQAGAVTDAGVRREVSRWLQANWDADLALLEWRTRLVDAGWAVPSWPVHAYGRGLEPAADAVVDDELRRVGAIGLPTGVGTGLAAPTILTHGSTELQRRLLRPILTGEHTWCQLFSEPGSGSDLAGLTTRAERDGDEFVVNGQKVWNTSAHHADVGLLLARTDWDVPKHRGITCFALPMRQPGIEVRPLRQMNGYSSFNEVFITDARAAVSDVIGDVGGGWAVGVTTLAHERRAFAAFGRRPPIAGDGRAAREARAEAEAYFSSYVWYPQRAGRADLLVERAAASGGNADAVVRQDLAATLTRQHLNTWTGQRARAALVLGREPGPEGSLTKLAATDLARRSARAHGAMAGAAGMLAGADAPLEGIITEVTLSVPAISIAGGTDEIQRNIIGERVLGLPKEPAVDRDLPFRDVPRNMR